MAASGLGEARLPDASDLESLTGRGVAATVDGETVLIGKAEMFGAEGIPPLSRADADAIADAARGRPHDDGRPPGRPRPRRHRPDGHAARRPRKVALARLRDTRHHADDHDLRRPPEGRRRDRRARSASTRPGAI